MFPAGNIKELHHNAHTCGESSFKRSVDYSYKLLVHLLSSEALFYKSTYEFKYDFSGNIN